MCYEDSDVYDFDHNSDDDVRVQSRDVDKNAYHDRQSITRSQRIMYNG